MLSEHGGRPCKSTCCITVPPDRASYKFVEKPGEREIAGCVPRKVCLRVSPQSRGMRTPQRPVAGTWQKPSAVAPTPDGSDRAALPGPRRFHRSPGTPRLAHQKDRPHTPVEM